MIVAMRRDGGVLLERRPESGIWGGLWCLPEFETASAANGYAHQILREATPTCLAATIRDVLRAGPLRTETRRYAEGFDWRSTSYGQVKLFSKILRTSANQLPLGYEDTLSS